MLTLQGVSGFVPRNYVQRETTPLEDFIKHLEGAREKVKNGQMADREKGDLLAKLDLAKKNVVGDKNSVPKPQPPPLPPSQQQQQPQPSQKQATVQQPQTSQQQKQAAVQPQVIQQTAQIHQQEITLAPQLNNVPLQQQNEQQEQQQEQQLQQQLQPQQQQQQQLQQQKSPQQNHQQQQPQRIQVIYNPLHH